MSAFLRRQQLNGGENPSEHNQRLDALITVNEKFNDVKRIIDEQKVKILNMENTLKDSINEHANNTKDEIYNSVEMFIIEKLNELIEKVEKVEDKFEKLEEKVLIFERKKIREAHDIESHKVNKINSLSLMKK